MNDINKYAYNLSKIKFKSSEMIYNKECKISSSYSDNKINGIVINFVILIK